MAGTETSLNIPSMPDCTHKSAYSHLDIDLLKWIFNGHDKSLVPHRIQISMNSLGFVQQSAAQFKLYIRITSTWNKNMKNTILNRTKNIFTIFIHSHQIMTANQMYPQLKESMLPQTSLSFSLQFICLY